MSVKVKKDFISEDFLNIKFAIPEIRTVPDSYMMSQEEYLACLKSATKRVIKNANHFLGIVEYESQKLNSK